MTFILGRDNDALRTNPPSGDEQLSDNGSNWLWAVTAVFLLSFLVYFVLSLRPRHGERFFHYIFATALLVGVIVYYAQASDLAWRVISQANQLQNGATRQVFWAKYVYWVVSFPAAILALGLLSGVSWASILYSVALSWIWVISYLVSAFTASNYKWGFFAFGTLAWLVLATGTFTDGRRSAGRVGSGQHFLFLSGWLHFLWIFYVIAFALSEGSNRIGVTPMFIWLGILDILMIPVMAFAVVGLSQKWDYNKLDLNFTQNGRVHRGVYPEKDAPAPRFGSAAPGITNTAPGGRGTV